MDDEKIVGLIYAHPRGIGEKYADRDDLDTEVARIRRKLADPLAPTTTAYFWFISSIKTR